jgi:hypothetical protein
VQHLRSLLEVQEEVEKPLWKKSKKSKKQKESEVFKMCKGKPKCELRQAKRVAKLAAMEKYKKIRQDFRDYKRQLRSVNFQKKMMPYANKVIKPLLLDALGAVKVEDDSSGQVQTCDKPLKEGELKTDCIPLAEMGSVALLRNYMNVQLNLRLEIHFRNVSDAIKGGIWKVFDPPWSIAKNSLILELGTIPLVGGVLATAVSVTFEYMYKSIKDGVEKAVDKITNLLKMKTVEHIDKAVFHTGAFTLEALKDPRQLKELGPKLTRVANAEQKNSRSYMQQQIKNGTKRADKLAAKRVAEGAGTDIKTAGKEVEAGEVEDEQEDQDQYEEEDAEDILADDE